MMKSTKGFLSLSLCQESEDGRKTDLPKLEESRKYILFTDWDSRLKEVERATMIATTIENIIIEAINENLHGANMVNECLLGFLCNGKQREEQWEHVAQEKEEEIKQLNRLNWEAYWQFLVKPHSQLMTLRCLTTSTQKMVPTLTNALFAGQLKSAINQPH